MEFKGTKGEWFVSGVSQIVSMPSQCKISNRISGWNEEEGKANAKLIAAAPDLLEALVDLVRFCEENNISAELELAKEAIKKATE